MARKKKNIIINKSEIEKQYHLINGKMVENYNGYEKCIKEPQTNEPIDRILITDEKKKELAHFINKYPEGKCIVEILIGKNETKKILGE